MARGFQGWPIGNGELADLRDDEFPTVVSGWSGTDLDLAGDGTHFGVVHSGVARLSTTSGDFDLGPGMFFALPGRGHVGSGSSAGAVVTSIGHEALFQIGGPLEPSGRLQYIDGCTDTLLIAPARLGDPCLNALYFPPGTDQTEHTHPSLRAGVVMSGSGVCRVPGEEIPLLPGCAFVIHPESLHSFATDEEPMVVVAFHPDSDVGPTDEEHPMINRTIVEGVPANRLQTGGIAR